VASAVSILGFVWVLRCPQRAYGGIVLVREVVQREAATY